MPLSLKFSMLTFCLFILFFIFVTFNQIEGVCGRWSSYNNGRGAWGGNGGWWGDSRSDWYGQYGTPEEYDYFGNYTTPYGYRYRSSDYYGNSYPYYGQYYSDSVDGAGLYFNIR